MEEARDGWLDRLRARDEEAVRELVRTFSGPLRRYLTNMLRNPADGEEMAQEALVRFVEGLPAFRGEASVKTYLFRIAHNLALNRIASAQSVHEVLPGELPEPRAEEDAPHRALLLEEAGEKLRRAVSLLPPQQRSVVILRTWQDLSFREVAQVLGMAEGTAKAHYFFALRNLRRYLEGRDDPR